VNYICFIYCSSASRAIGLSQAPTRSRHWVVRVKRTPSSSSPCSSLSFTLSACAHTPGPMTRARSAFLAVSCERSPHSRRRTGPSARCAHSASMVGNGNVFVYGGWDGNQMLNDLHVLHTGMSYHTTPPRRRAGLTCSSLSRARARVVSWWRTDLVSAPQPILTWSKPITSGPVPGPRAGHTSSAVGNRLFVFGGGNGIRYLNDLHLLDAGNACHLHSRVCSRACCP
jgi:hypothetical protein